MPVTNEVIREVLKSLDHSNDTLWTDDGSPLVGIVQKLTNDSTVTRAQINEAEPGFNRIVTVAVEDEAGEDPTEGIGTAPDPSIVVAAAPAKPPEDNGFTGEEPSEEQIRLVLIRRIQDAETAIMEAKAAVSKAQNDVVRAEQRLGRAHLDHQRKFPPITAAANIKQHLERQQEILRERVTGSKFEPNFAQNPVDATLMDRKRDNGRNGKRGNVAAAPFLPRKAAISY